VVLVCLQVHPDLGFEALDVGSDADPGQRDVGPPFLAGDVVEQLLLSADGGDVGDVQRAEAMSRTWSRSRSKPGSAPRMHSRSP